MEQVLEFISTLYYEEGQRVSYQALYFNMWILWLSFLFELFCFLDCIQIAQPLIL